MGSSTLRRFAALLCGLGLALALVGGAAAGGWSLIMLDGDSSLVGVESALTAGTPVTIGFTVLQHGDKPMDGLTPRANLVNETTGARMGFEARAEGGPGHYVVEIVLSTPGTYSWEIEAYGSPTTFAPLTVVAPPPVSAPAPAFSPLPWALLSTLLVGALAILAVRLRRRPVEAT